MTLSPVPPARRERKRLSTRQAILDAGQQLFAARPMEGVSIDEIVDIADVSKGSFYNHFEDKQDLASAIFALIEGDLELHVLSANREIPDPAERVARALGVVLRYGFDHPERVQAILGLSQRKTVASSPLNAGVAADVQNGLSSGRFKGVDVESGVLTVIGTIIVTLRHVSMSRVGPPPTALAVTMGAALLRALGVDYDEAQAVAQHVSDTLLAREGQ